MLDDAMVFAVTYKSVDNYRYFEGIKQTGSALKPKKNIPEYAVCCETDVLPAADSDVRSM